MQVAYCNAQLADWLWRQIKSSRADLQVLHTAAGTLLEQLISLANYCSHHRTGSTQGSAARLNSMSDSAALCLMGAARC